MSVRTGVGTLVNERQCLSKRAYTTMSEAYGVAQKAARRRGVWLRAYHCPNCGWYHLTKTSPKAA